MHERLGTIHVPEAIVGGKRLAMWMRKGSWRITAYRARLGKWMAIGRHEEQIPTRLNQPPRRVHIVRAVKREAHRLAETDFTSGAAPLLDACINADIITAEEREKTTYEQVLCADGEEWTEVEVYQTEDE